MLKSEIFQKAGEIAAGRALISSMKNTRMRWRITYMVCFSAAAFFRRCEEQERKNKNEDRTA